MRRRERERDYLGDNSREPSAGDLSAVYSLGAHYITISNGATVQRETTRAREREIGGGGGRGIGDSGRLAGDVSPLQRIKKRKRRQTSETGNPLRDSRDRRRGAESARRREKFSGASFQSLPPPPLSPDHPAL